MEIGPRTEKALYPWDSGRPLLARAGQNVASSRQFSPCSQKEVESELRQEGGRSGFSSRIEEKTRGIMKQTGNNAGSVATTRAMNRSEFLRLAARMAGACAAGSLLGPAALALGAEAEPDRVPVLLRPIPSSGQMLPVIGVGTAVVYELDTADAKFPVLVETVRAFLAHGGAVIDTSPTYGRAERSLGEIFRRIGGRERAFLATKISTTGEQAGIDSVAASMRDLGTNKIDLLQVHNIRDTAVHLRTIRRLQEAGKVRYAGITTSFRSSYEEYELIMRREKLDFIQIDYALDNRIAEERILPLARERGMAVLINLPFGRGRLFAKARGRPLPPWAAEIDCTSWAQLFLKFVLAHPAVTAVIPGTDRPEFAIDNLNAARGRIPDARMRERIVSYWDQLG
jgi:aryl-alcohol dehydrogenase-like predicted oxidoreductase